METKEFRNKLKEAKCILERAKAEYKKVRTNLSNEVLEPYNLHVGSKVIYKRKEYKVHNAIINSKNLVYVTIIPMEFEYFEGENREQVPIECLV
nr:MAG TPA: hypothetical protein [Crassvirales sp.]